MRQPRCCVAKVVRPVNCREHLQQPVCAKTYSMTSSARPSKGTGILIVTHGRLGTISFRICNHLPAMTASKLLKPVMLPPGLERFVTRPSPIGSETPTKTMGIVWVACFSAGAGGVLGPTKRC